MGFATSSAHGQEQICSQGLQKVTFKPQTIFDENEQGFSIVHRWANAIHIDTKKITLENEAAFFIEKCDKNFADMAELERHLRSRKYLRDAKITSDEMVENITVTTWDNWSLMPTISFGRQGGESTYSFGIKERNLLGLGIDAEVQTYKNSQRKGYKLKSTIPLFRKKNIDIKLRFADNDDGTQQSLFLQKHFASFYTHDAYNIGFNEESRNDTLYQNDSELAIFAHDISFKNAEYAWLDFNHNSALLRYRIGMTQDQDKFSPIDDTDSSISSAFLPQDRDFLYPWFGVDYIEKNFRKLTNIHLITQIEDFNHGWQISSRLGLSDGTKENNAWALFQVNIDKGFEIHDKALLLMNVALSGDIYEQQDHRLLLRINTEYFYNIDPRWGFYLSNTNIVSTNQYLDQPVTIGGNTGLRGFPLQYQHGEHSIKLTSEIRYYPHINLFKLFDLAGAAFMDTGKTFGDSVVKNSEDTWLYSVGIGARLYSPHSAGSHQVIHIDFAFPQSDTPDIDSFEIRVEAKQSF
ncbi:hypothetical protein [Candidatus Colwellia aromaticivorans]|uniref:hypothetical protein n=1 Tax=Candidatus Colwellia aromaticivorans TaxID=2267621 RepID=UPI000DF30B41|nr:hypothetical protein [Candidatus Colwellia aromaticivorans]